LLENLKDHLEDGNTDGKLTERILEKYGSKFWIGFIWLRGGRSGELF